MIKKIFRNESFSAFLTSIHAVVLVAVPLVLLLVSVQKEAATTFEWAKQNIESNQGTVMHITEWVQKHDLQKYVNLNEIVSKASNAVIGWVTGF